MVLVGDRNLEEGDRGGLPGRWREQCRICAEERDSKCALVGTHRRVGNISIGDNSAHMATAWKVCGLSLGFGG